MFILTCNSKYVEIYLLGWIADKDSLKHYYEMKNDKKW